MVVRCRDVLAYGAVAATLASAAPLDYFPINSQLPPVARISEAFEFIFSPLTFSSPLTITYRLENAPEWLSIDSSSRRLFGTPSDDDVPPGEVVGIPISLVAEDDTGSTTTNPTLVVSRNPPPTVAIPVSEQLPKFGTYIAPSSLHLHPSRPFSFSFDEHTFRTDTGDGGLNYYAVSGDNAPLPSWITFNSGNLSFSGETPPFESLVQPPQTFSFQLVASDVVGFASISMSFSIMVGNHELTADPPVVKVNATQDKLFGYEGLPEVLKLDGRPLEQENVTSIAALDLPPWLSFDNETWNLDGTPNSDAESINITVAVIDKYFDSLNLTVSITFGLFLSDLPDLELRAGGDFSFDLKEYLSRPSDIEVTVDGDSDAPWARFNSSSMILLGTVPEHLSAKSETEPRVAFRATSKYTNETETKTMNIRITSSARSPSPTNSPQPSAEPTDSGSDSRKNLLWLLVIPILLVFIGIILLLFYIRRRRQGPRRINIRQVSGPIPGTFTVKHGESLAQSSARNMVDIGPSRLSDGGATVQTAQASSNQRSSRSGPTSSLSGSGMPHAMMAMYSRAKSPDHSVIFETRSSWSAGQRNQSSEGSGKTDEASLLSDTSIGEGDAHIADAYTIIRRTREEAIQALSVPMNSEPFSIQTTPEFAYVAGEAYDTSLDKAVTPTIGYAVQPRPGQQQTSGLGLREVGKRISNLWRKESGGERRRNSMQSNSTSQTTATSILTSGISGGAEEEATTSANVVVKPTIIHIPSRPGEVRRMSRRVDSSLFFGGRALTKSPERVIHETPELPPNLEEYTNPRNSGSSWDRLARNSLGIAYKDLLITESEKAVARPELQAGAFPNNRITHDMAQDLLSPGQWPQSNISVNMVGIAKTSPANTSSELPRLPPTSAQAKGRVGGHRRQSRVSGANLYRIPSTVSRSNESYSSGDELHFGRVRTKRAPGEIRALVSQTPSPENRWSPPTRPLPETPTRPTRVPLANRPNELSFYAPGGDAQGSRKSWKTTRSMKSTKSTRSVWGEDDDDDDAWEDIRPPTYIDGWDDGGDSDGSFAVYI
ncbi:hypothetical protein F4677DRAFT_441386 [Hypoxylon crocopeplum]|nr:hypothetical protein F4677DRAFT_441386 [Hypoxylon crocopeplum]